ncbi:cytochrome p450 [Favolaschia claudopus]|uniref:Cytochrome p450 n=1 Tax=Favolaschia claudopus TaxID=2862362 RepID=A0AAW0DJS4_9AGAR
MSVRLPQTHHLESRRDWSWLTLWPVLFVGFSLLVYYIHCRNSKHRLSPRLPPGPRGLPLLKNIFDLPREQHWLKFAELGEVWGDIFSLTAFGKTMILVNSVKIAEDLLDVRGANFSDRPFIPVGGEKTGFVNSVALAQYGNRVRAERKLFHQLFGTESAIRRMTPLISAEVQNVTAAVSLRIAYGYQLQEGFDPFLEMFDTSGQNFFVATVPGAFLADTIPILRYWPRWLPGGGFHDRAERMSQQVHGSVNTAFEYVKREMASGTAETSFVSTLLQEEKHDEYLIKWAAASIEIGGSDTTAAQLEAFFLAMTLYPEVQIAAQEEIDRVVGNNRIPDISDRFELPYVDALCKEVVRWHVAAPLAVPHRTREDYIYDRGDGKEPLLIPKDSLIIPNIWKMAHDPERYAEPMTFNPTRFLAVGGKEAEKDPADICFGYGRRVCPGILLGQTAIFLECSAILAVFNISKARNATGKVMEARFGQTSTTVSRVFPFKCVIEPRSAQALTLIS